MEEKQLVEIRNNLVILPELKKRLEKLNRRITEAEQEVQDLLYKFNAETNDVEKLEKESLSATLLRLVGRYEDKLDKEKEEMLTAKMNYDRAVSRVKELFAEREELTGRVNKIENDKAAFEVELRDREARIMNSITGETAAKYRGLDKEHEQLSKQLLETSEALRAAGIALQSAESAMEELQDADDMATFDVWTKGGIFSHVAKYEHIDNAQEEFNRLSARLKELQKELSDVNLLENLEISEIDSATRTIDFWFDNIFTDLNVRDRIRENMDQLSELQRKIRSVIGRLESSAEDINARLAENEDRKKDLLIFNS